MTLREKNEAIRKFWNDADFRGKIITAGKKQGILPKGISPENFAALLKFLTELLPLIFSLFSKKPA